MALLVVRTMIICSRLARERLEERYVCKTGSEGKSVPDISRDTLEPNILRVETGVRKSAREGIFMFLYYGTILVLAPSSGRSSYFGPRNGLPSDTVDNNIRSLAFITQMQ